MHLADEDPQAINKHRTFNIVEMSNFAATGLMLIFSRKTRRYFLLVIPQEINCESLDVVPQGVGIRTILEVPHDQGRF